MIERFLKEILVLIFVVPLMSVNAQRWMDTGHNQFYKLSLSWKLKDEPTTQGTLWIYSKQERTLWCQLPTHYSHIDLLTVCGAQDVGACTGVASLVQFANRLYHQVLTPVPETHRNICHWWDICCVFTCLTSINRAMLFF